jgi:hypothetical protein
MAILVSIVIAMCAIPIIRSLQQLERNTAEIVNKATKFDMYIDAIKKIS